MADYSIGYSVPKNIILRKLRDMGDSDLPVMEPINQQPAPKRDFRTVTRSGNELIKTITTTSGAVDHDQIIKEGLESAISEYVAIIVEKAELVTTEEKYKFLRKLDFKSIFETKPKSNSVVNDKLQHMVDKIWSDQKLILKKMTAIDQLEQVSFWIIKN